MVDKLGWIALGMICGGVIVGVVGGYVMYRIFRGIYQ